MYSLQSLACGGYCCCPFHSVLFAVFLGSDDEHGAVRVVQHVVGHGAEDRAAQLAHPAGPHHNPRGALGLRHGAQRLTRPLKVLVVLKRNLKIEKMVQLKPSYCAKCFPRSVVFYHYVLKHFHGDFILSTHESISVCQIYFELLYELETPSFVCFVIWNDLPKHAQMLRWQKMVVRRFQLRDCDSGPYILH